MTLWGKVKKTYKLWRLLRTGVDVSEVAGFGEATMAKPCHGEPDVELSNVVGNMLAGRNCRYWLKELFMASLRMDLGKMQNIHRYLSAAIPKEILEREAMELLQQEPKLPGYEITKGAKTDAGKV